MGLNLQPVFAVPPLMDLATSDNQRVAIGNVAGRFRQFPSHLRKVAILQVKETA